MPHCDCLCHLRRWHHFTAQPRSPRVLMDSSVPTIALPNPSHASTGTTSLGFHGSHRYHQTTVELTALPGAPFPASAVLGKFQPGHLLSWLIHPAPPPLSYYIRHRLPAPFLPPSQPISISTAHPCQGLCTLLLAMLHTVHVIVLSSSCVLLFCPIP